MTNNNNRINSLVITINMAQIIKRKSIYYYYNTKPPFPFLGLVNKGRKEEKQATHKVVAEMVHMGRAWFGGVLPVKEFLEGGFPQQAVPIRV